MILLCFRWSFFSFKNSFGNAFRCFAPAVSVLGWSFSEVLECLCVMFWWVFWFVTFILNNLFGQAFRCYAPAVVVWGCFSEVLVFHGALVIGCCALVINIVDPTLHNWIHGNLNGIRYVITGAHACVMCHSYSLLSVAQTRSLRSLLTIFRPPGYRCCPLICHFVHSLATLACSLPYRR